MGPRSFSLIIIVLTLAAPVFSGFFSLSEPARKWRSKTISACWETDVSVLKKYASHLKEPTIDVYPASDPAKNLTKATLQALYPESLTGISIEDFGDCPTTEPTEDSDILYVAAATTHTEKDDFEGFASLGDERFLAGNHHSALLIDFKALNEHFHNSADILSAILEKLPGQITSSEEFQDRMVRFKNDLLTDQVRTTIAHEFGHVLGLRHEQARSDVYDAHRTNSKHKNPKLYQFCQTSSGDLGEETGRDPSFTGVSREGTPYDLFSVMNDCQTDMIDLAHQARLLCEYRTALRNSKGIDSDTLRKLDHLFSKCDFIQSHPYPIGPSDTDQAAISAIYRDVHLSDPQSTDFRKSKTLMQWVDVLNRAFALQ